MVFLNEVTVFPVFVSFLRSLFYFISYGKCFGFEGKILFVGGESVFVGDEPVFVDCEPVFVGREQKIPLRETTKNTGHQKFFVQSFHLLTNQSFSNSFLLFFVLLLLQEVETDDVFHGSVGIGEAELTLAVGVGVEVNH